jgi:Holliday junction resolvase-like predicted endonuclease|tara:strand:- start:10550 stop:10873 length:324 start_codon:yes stop_codon:yes gene_type:complete
MGKFSREKGKRGERMFRDWLRDLGWTSAKRGVQYNGLGGADVVCKELDDVMMFEVKNVERLSIPDACDQAVRDAKGKIAVVAHKRNNHPWRFYLDEESFGKLLQLAV